MKKNINHTLIAAVVLVGSFMAQGVHAQTCSFSRTLSLGSEGEDVRCLQKFLNNQGFIISNSGAGSVGKETDEFRSKTAAAVKSWQTSQALDADGFFGPSSQRTYNLINSESPIFASNQSLVVSSEISKEVDQLKKLIDTLNSSKTNETKQENFDSSVASLVEKLYVARDDIEDAKDDDVDVDDAEEELNAGLENFLLYIKSVIDNDESKQKSFSDRIKNSLDEIDAILEKESLDVDDLEDALNDFKDDLDELEDEIDDADDRGDDVDDAQDLFDEAEDLLDDAEDEFEREDYSDVREIIEELEDLINDIFDELDIEAGDDRDDARDAINDAKDAINDAKDAIDDAEDDGDDVRDAEDLLDEAEDLLDDAEDEFDDGDYDDAIDDAEDAEDKADDAIDEL